MQAEQVKIGIETSYDDSKEIDVEFSWADHLGENRYQIKNFLFYAYGISYDDIVEAKPKYDDDPYLYFVRVLEKSGHRTLRIALDESIKESDNSKKILADLSAMNCGYEGMKGEKYFVINVQPPCDFDAVRLYLNEQDVKWEYVDPTYDQVQNNRA